LKLRTLKMAGIYAIGSNGSGQLGIGHKEDVSVPKEVLFLGTPVASPGPVTIRAGGNHTLLLTASGQLFSSGDASQGARGLDSGEGFPDTRFSPVTFTNEISTDEEFEVRHCAATWEASVIVKNDKLGRATQVYSFGTGNKGELGQGELIFRSAKAQLIKDFPPPGTEVVDLSACVGHVVAVLDNGDVYGWGGGRKGQLGEPGEIVHSPRRIPDVPFRVSRAVCGREFTYLLGASGAEDSLLLGADKWDIRASSIPAEVKGWTDVGAGWGNVFLLKDDGRVLSWGRNDQGQCAPPDLPKVSRMAIGSEHALALSNEGDVLAWGWGEHGNCGPQSTKGDVKETWSVVASSRYLPSESKIVSIGCGCATSWICVASE
jgi:protein ATS1